MISKWFRQRKKATKLRRKGRSLSYIHNKFGIPKSTLSGWFKFIVLTDKQRSILLKNRNAALIKARIKALEWHHKQKQERIKTSNEEAALFIKRLGDLDKSKVELALAFLYLGEGSKKGVMSLGSSNPEIVKFYIHSLNKLYGIEIRRFKFDLHIRFDQNPLQIKDFWSRTLGVQVEQFRYCIADKRTINKKTTDEYKGVCVACLGNSHVQRKLLEIARIYSSMVTTTRGD